MVVRLDGRVAVVTGAGSGLGREHALLLASLGARVVVNDTGGKVDGGGSASTPADKVVSEIVAAGGEAAASYASVSERAGAASIIDTALERFRRIDVLVNNAGILRDKSFAKMELDDFEAVLAVHLLGAVYCTKAAWPHLIEQEYGRVIVTTSVAGTNGNFGQSNYGAAKMGLLGFMNCLAIEGKRKNVLVNAISPGAHTRMTQGIASDDDTVGRHLKPEYVSPAVAWLSSERCDVAGCVVTAAAGGFGRLHFFETAGVQAAPPGVISVDTFDASVSRIFDLESALPTSAGPEGFIQRRLSNEIGVSIRGTGA